MNITTFTVRFQSLEIFTQSQEDLIKTNPGITLIFFTVHRVTLTGIKKSSYFKRLCPSRDKIIICAYVPASGDRP